MFYHIKLKCYIAVELKVKEFILEFASEMGFYLTAKYINRPVGVSEYKILDKLSNDLLKELPTEDDINLHINIEE